jgi:hypothetical protein
MMIAVAEMATREPTASPVLGRTPSTSHNQMTAVATQTPPYAA